MADHDVIVLGGGPGGYASALRAAVRGLSVAMVEADRVGGTCLHWGCIPSKAMLHVGGILDEARDAERFGLDLTVGGIDVERMAAFRQGVQDQLTSGLEGLVRARGITHLTGWGTVGPDGHTVTVTGDDGERALTADHVVIAVGSAVRSLPGVEVDGDVVITSDTATHLTRIPERALVIGSGAVGLEFASLFRSLGASEVTVVEALDRIAPLEDVDVSTALARAFRKRGITTVAGTTATDVTAIDGPTGTAATVSLSDGDAHVVDTVLVAVGRRPRTEGIGLDDLGVLDERGYVVADPSGRTAVDGVWAVGDVLAPPSLALAHAAFAEGFAVADQIAGERVTPVDHTLVPRVTYCTPEVASVGLTEAQARERHGDAVTATTTSMRGNAKGIIHGSDGFVKVVAGGPEGAVLGVHVVGPHATDLIAEAQLITAWEALPAEVAALVHPHPTVAEAIGEAHLAAAGLPFHTH
ncbi:dihydrolipoyl dehydrogenase [Euzebya sp.]|uniref:dihydrolipoyl dehydrogenase n=1 Tax=Euzebya sp. TaxID=1971409 RepID=UPI0035195174